METLTEIGLRHHTDKAYANGYTKVYAESFEQIRDKPIRLLEIGAGDLGASHKMWKDYFPNGEIFCIDTFLGEAQKGLREKMESYGISVFEGNQLSRIDFQNALELFGGEFDIIIDDGAHMPDAIQISLAILLPVLKSGGIYVVEDLLCARNRLSRLDEINRKTKETGFTLEHVAEYPLEDSLAKLDSEGFWESNALATNEKEYLADNISSWKLKVNGNLCFIRKK